MEQGGWFLSAGILQRIPAGRERSGRKAGDKMEKQEKLLLLDEKLKKAQKILVGIGAEWKPQTAQEEIRIQEAASRLLALLKDRDYYIITSLEGQDAERIFAEKEHMAAPFGVSFTEKDWEAYTGWLAGTLNRELVILELGEGFQNPSLIRWPFEKTVMLNQKAFLFRVHRQFSQIPEEIKEKAVPVAESSVDFILSCGNPA